MAFLGRRQQGEVVALVLACHDASDTPALPDNPPMIKLRSDSGAVRTVTMPITDRYVVTGLFIYPLRLDSSFPAGRYSATYFYKSGSYYGLDIDTFEVLAGGDAAGAIVAHFWWQRPEANYLVQQTEAGSLLLRRNPSV